MSRIFDALSANLPLKISEYKRTGKLCFSWDGDTSSDWAKEIQSNYRISKTRHFVFLSSFSSFNSSFCFPQDFSNNFCLEFCFSNKFNSRTVQNKAFKFKTKIKSLQKAVMVADTYNKLFFFVSRLLNNYLNLLIQSFYTVSESRSCWFGNRYHRNKSTLWDWSLKSQRQKAT